ncbi:MAG: hypothetical protein HQL65_06245 [Magnetococcales bacterium]|nr:hypothetical protein [Magnetococcales bacterium]
MKMNGLNKVALLAGAAAFALGATVAQAGEHVKNPCAPKNPCAAKKDEHKHDAKKHEGMKHDDGKKKEEGKKDEAKKPEAPKH